MIFAVALSLETGKTFGNVAKSFHVVVFVVENVVDFGANARFCEKKVVYDSAMKLFLKLKILTWSAYLD
jgi:hypothetical protein